MEGPAKAGECVVVLGSGKMGILIAGELAFKGCTVYLNDFPLPLQKSYLSLRATLEQYQKDDLIQDSDIQQIMSRINYCKTWDFTHEEDKKIIPSVKYVIEAIIENLGIKQDLFQKLDLLFPTFTIFCSNTLNFYPNELRKKIQNQNRKLINLRFLYPVFFIPQIEITSEKKNPLVRHITYSHGHSVYKEINEKNESLNEDLENETVVGVSRWLETDLQKTPFYFFVHQIKNSDIYENRKKLTLQEIQFYFNVQKEKRKSVENEKSKEYSRTTESEKNIGNEQNECVICCENVRNSLFYPCGHIAACLPCAKQILVSSSPFCPICRIKLTDAIQTFVV